MLARPLLLPASLVAAKWRAMKALSRAPHVEVVWCSSPRNDIDGCYVPHHSFAFPKKGSHHGGVFTMVIASGD